MAAERVVAPKEEEVVITGSPVEVRPVAVVEPHTDQGEWSETLLGRASCAAEMDEIEPVPKLVGHGDRQAPVSYVVGSIL